MPHPERRISVNLLDFQPTSLTSLADLSAAVATSAGRTKTDRAPARRRELSLRGSPFPCESELEWASQLLTKTTMTLLRALVFAAATLCVPVAADAVTVRDIIELTKAGLADDVIVALIDADRTIFTLDAAQIVDLKKAGVSEKVVLKMLATRREFEPASPISEPSETSNNETASQPPVVVIGAPPAPSSSTTVTVVMPYFFPFPVLTTTRDHIPRREPAPVFGDESTGFGRFFNDGWAGPPIWRGPKWSMPPMNPIPKTQ
jgi:hypothetical protein